MQKQIKQSDLPVKRKEKVKLTVTMDVSAPQAYALMEMFNTWNRLSQMGSSRYVAFFADGDGDFHPKCRVETDPVLPEMPKEQIQNCRVEKKAHHDIIADIAIDYDAIGWSLHEKD